MKIFVLSFYSCKEYVSKLPCEKTSILSIRDLNAAPYFTLNMNENIHEILTLNFSDKAPLNVEKAKCIIDFIYRSIDENVENILIHCNLGMSRSKTIGIVTYEKLKGVCLAEQMKCNKFIYETLNSVWEEKLKIREITFSGEIITNFVNE